MILGLKVLALIPARGGSKGLPRKNVLELSGKPMIAWSIEAAKGSRYIDNVVVSTDDDEIAAVSRKHGAEVPFMRPDSLAQDGSTTIDVAVHAVKQLPDYDVLVILQPTSPLRISEDIDQTLERMIDANTTSAVSVTEPAKSPFWSYTVENDGRLATLIDEELASKRRQDLPDAYVLNGAVYATCVREMIDCHCLVTADTVAHIMPPNRSLDIDTEFDFKLVEFYMREYSYPSTQAPVYAVAAV